MLAFLYLAMAFLIGLFFLKACIPAVFKVPDTVSLFNSPVRLSPFMIWIPSCFITGTLITIWCTYIFSYIYRNDPSPLKYSNLLTFAVLTPVIIIAAVIYLLKRKKSGEIASEPARHTAGEFIRQNRIALIFIAVSLAVSAFLMIYPFHIRNGTIYSGFTVCGDFGPHLAIIRSFSLGTNIPPQYPYYADDVIRYHFLFDFLGGNLEYLGLRLDWAYNIPGILACTSFFMLLYSFTVILTGKTAVALMTFAFSILRSAFSFFRFFTDSAPFSFKNILNSIFTNSTWANIDTAEIKALISPGPNVYTNQRHFVFNISLVLLLLIIFYPLFIKMINTLVSAKLKKSKKAAEFFKAKDSWSPDAIVPYAAAGFLLGLSGFVNISLVMGGLMVLFVMAIFSKHRLSYAITAGIAIAVLLIETACIMKGANTSIKPYIALSFIDGPTGFWGVLSFYSKVLGIFPFIIIASMIILPKGSRPLILAFSVPLLLSTFIQLAPDKNTSHKFFNLSIVLLNIFAALFLYMLIKYKDRTISIISGILIFAMVATGISDVFTFINQNKEDYFATIRIKTDDPLTNWFVNNTGPDEIILSDTFYWVNPILLSGRRFFAANPPYYAWSVGCDTNLRWSIMNRIYGGTNPDEVKKLIKDNKINYIVIQKSNRESKDYKLNEQLFKDNFKLVKSIESIGANIYRTY